MKAAQPSACGSWGHALTETTVGRTEPCVNEPKTLGRLDKVIARSRSVRAESNHSNHQERLYAKRRPVHASAVNVRSDDHRKATTEIAR